MKRRTLGLLAGTSLAALKFGHAGAQPARNAGLLQTTLTPFGAERAGNADGSIPAWTGGYTTVPAGFQSGDYMPSPFAGEQSILTIDSSNMSQHADKLNDGTMLMMTKFGFSIKVYPTHRSSAMPQGVYDATAKNATTAQMSPAGPQYGFTNAIGGLPFPIPDVSDPLVAGAQVMWNHLITWNGYALESRDCTWVVNGGRPPVLTNTSKFTFDYPFYRPGATVESYKGFYYRAFVGPFYGPPNLIGEELLIEYSSSPLSLPNNIWELLNGQGRVRKAPELSYDTPDSFSDGIAYYDDVFGFIGALDRFNWKYLGKKELYVPYHNNDLVASTPQIAQKEYFIDPNLVRWELHRVWVVEATLRPGYRHATPRRMYYVDEDIWRVTAADAWDAGGNLVHISACYNYLRPDVPVTLFCGHSLMDVQTGNWAAENMYYNEKAAPTVKFVDSWPDDVFDPQSMAAAAQY